MRLTPLNVAGQAMMAHALGQGSLFAMLLMRGGGAASAAAAWQDELDFVWPADLDSSASLVEEASHWINDSMRELQHHHSRFSWKKEEDILEGAFGWATDARSVAFAAWDPFSQLGVYFQQILDEFAPLERLFANSDGFVMLVTEETSLRTFGNITASLMNTSLMIEQVSAAVGTMADILGHVVAVVQRLLRSRKVAANITKESAASFLSGLGFDDVLSSMLGFQNRTRKHVEGLKNVTAVFAPVLDIYQSTAGEQSRRLTDGSKQSTIVATDQQKYTNATILMVESWRGIETLGIDMCPYVLEYLISAKLFQCRLEEALNVGSIAGLERLIKDGDLEALCEGGSTSTLAPGSTDVQPGLCPSDAQSSHINESLLQELRMQANATPSSSDDTDDIMETAQQVPILTWVLATVGSILCLLLCGAGVCGLICGQMNASKSRDVDFVDGSFGSEEAWASQDYAQGWPLE